LFEEEDGGGGDGEALFEKEADNMWEESVEQATSAAPLLRAALHACRQAHAAQCEATGRACPKYRKGGSPAGREAAGGAAGGRGAAPFDSEVEAVLLAAGRWREALAGSVCTGGEGGSLTAVSFLWRSRVRLAQWALAE
jgi:hypothetical protein